MLTAGRRLALWATKTSPVRSFSTAIPFEMALNPKSVNANRLGLTKITATIGPASEQLPTLHEVVSAGVNIMRINFSHATYEEALLRVTNLNSFRGGFNSDGGVDDLGQKTNMRAIMLDTQGPEIRTGSFDGVKNVELQANNTITLTIDETHRTKQTTEKLWISYKSLPKTVEPGNIILVDDGAISLEVLSVLGDTDISCKILNSGTLGNKKGVNMPGLVVDLPAMSNKDREDIRWGIEHDIDMIAASFVRKPSDVTEIRNFCGEVIRDLETKKIVRSMPLIVSKVESTEALQNFEDILDVSDAIMVARGDLAVEIPMETLAGAQDEIVRRCNETGKPVIVATQMLESMQKNPRPTRAEIIDVSNAVGDRADSVMLSGESAQGKYPIGAVSMMHKIILQTEALAERKALQNGFVFEESLGMLTKNCDDAVAKATVTLANSLTGDVAGIVVDLPRESNQLYLESNLPQLIAKYKPNVPIYVLVPTYKAGRRLQIHRAIQPVLALDASASAQSVLSQLKEAGKVSKYDQYVVLSVKANGENRIQLV